MFVCFFVCPVIDWRSGQGVSLLFTQCMLGYAPSPPVTLNSNEPVQKIDEYRVIDNTVYYFLSSGSHISADPFSLFQSVTPYHILVQYKHPYKLPSQLTTYFYRTE